MAVSCLSPVKTQIFISAFPKFSMQFGTPWKQKKPKIVKISIVCAT